MRARIFLAYSGAALTLAVAALVPFVLMGTFTRVVARAGLRVDPAYSGGNAARTMQRDGYRIVINEPVYPRALQEIDPFVQVAFTPAAALPRVVSEDVDLDGDGHADVHIRLTVPADAQARPEGSVTALNSRYESFAMPGEASFSRLMAQAGGAVVVRVPLAQARR